MENLIHIDIIAAIIFVGLFLGFFLSYFFLKKSFKTNSPNIFMGLLLLTFSLNMLEGWLNYTGYIFKVLHLVDFSEPTNFLIAPLLYLFTSRQLGEKKSKKEWMHYLLFVFWLLYMTLFFAQSADFKYNSYIGTLRLDLEPLKVKTTFSDNPLGIRNYVNELTILHILIYCIILIRKLLLKSKSLDQSIFTTSNETLRSLRNGFYHFAGLFILLVAVKIYFKGDVGDYLLYLYLTFMLITTTFQIVVSSSYFERPSSFLEFPSLKYQKSSLADYGKEIILKKIKKEMEQNGYHKSNLASLSELSNAINESSHHVSQVINEKMKISFFELLATYRIKEAQQILSSVEGKKLTIEEIAEQVGYNSKSAFNTAFKKFTLQTPSEFRNAN